MAVTSRSANELRKCPESIYDVLKSEHRQVQKLFKQILNESKFNEVYGQIEKALLLHMQGEEEYFYPNVKTADGGFMINEALVEHKAAQNLMSEIDATNSTDEMWLPRVKVLSEIIDRHIKKEENGLFKEAKKSFNEGKECEIAENFIAAKLKDEGKFQPNV